MRSRVEDSRLEFRLEGPTCPVPCNSSLGLRDPPELRLKGPTRPVPCNSSKAPAQRIQGCVRGYIWGRESKTEPPLRGYIWGRESKTEPPLRGIYGEERARQSPPYGVYMGKREQDTRQSPPYRVYMGTRRKREPPLRGSGSIVPGTYPPPPHVYPPPHMYSGSIIPPDKVPEGFGVEG